LRYLISQAPRKNAGRNFCELAEKEQDRDKLLELTKEISRLRAEKDERLRDNQRDDD
jgi:hypothetical protein